MPRGEPSPADQLVLGTLHDEGLPVSFSQLERWRAAGLLPANARTALGRGRGSTSSVRPEALTIARELARRAKRGVPLEQTTLEIFFECADADVPERPLTRALLWYEARHERSAGIAGYAAGLQARLSGQSEDDTEDAVALAIARHYDSLDKAVISQVRRAVPHVEDLALLAVLGPSGLGEDSTASIPMGSEDDDAALALRQAVQDALLDDAPPIWNVQTYDPDHRQRAIRAAGVQALTRARDTLQDIAEFVRLVQFLLVVTPEDQIVGAWADVFGSSSILTMLCMMFPPHDLMDPISWRIATKLVIAQVVSEGFHRQLVGLRDLFFRDLEPLEQALQASLARHAAETTVDGRPEYPS